MIEEKNTINDPRHERTKKTLRIIGIVLTVIGTLCLVVGTTDFFMSFNSFGSPTLFFLCFIGMPFLAAGITMIRFSIIKEVASYTASQTAPITKDVVNYMVDNTSNSVARGVKKVSDEIKENSTRDNKIGPKCPYCGTINEENARFCDNCGKSLTKVCPACGEENDADANFCRYCGKKI